MSASTLLRAARHAAGLSQRDLSDRARKPQSTIARLESGKVIPGSELLEELVESCGWTLTVLPTLRNSVAAHAAEIAANLEHGNERRAYRTAVQLADDLAAEHGAERVALAVTPPETTGDTRYDALIAGITESRLAEEDLPLPRWLKGPADILDPVWYVDRYSQDDLDTLEATPEPLRRRGVAIDAAELASI